MGNKSNKGSNQKVMIVSGLVMAGLFAFLIYGGNVLMKKEVDKEDVVHSVTLVKPPQPPKPVEKKPEPEMEKPKEQETQIQDVQQPKQDAPSDQPPPGEQLGIDAEGGAGADGFGLVGNKGGRSLVGSGGSYDPNAALLRKYGWYIHSIEQEIGKQLAKKSELPSGNYQALVIIVLDDRGNILKHRIYESSGSQKMDSAVLEALSVIRHVNTPPPEGMPRVMRLKINSPV